jgi:plastocyanin
MESYTLEKHQLFAYSILLTILVVMTPITSYQEKLETIENLESTPIEKIVRIIGTEENSVSPNSIYVRTFDVVTFVNLDGTQGVTTHTVVSVKTGTTEPDGTFDSGLIRTGENFKFTLTESGIYEYFDPTYPNIRGTIHVV